MAEIRDVEDEAGGIQNFRCKKMLIKKPMM